MTDISLPWARAVNLSDNHPAIARLVKASHSRSLNRGDVLIVQEDPADAVFVVASGRLRAVRYTRNGHEIWLADFLQGALVGEMSALTGVLRSSMVIASENTKIQHVSKSLFLEVMLADGEFATAVARLLAERIGDTSSHLADVVGMSVTTRLHVELCKLATMQTDDDEVFEWIDRRPVTELAVRIHASREATSRAFSALERSGLIKRLDGVTQIIVPKDHVRY